MSSNSDVLIIGGGLAGLCCALRLHQRGLSFQVLEASDGVGGRVRTDRVEGFLLDRGFQVLLTAYPEARRVTGRRLRVRDPIAKRISPEGQRFGACPKGTLKM